MSTPQLRQAVFLTGNLAAAEREIEEAFGFTNPFRDVEGMAKVGFAHAVYGFVDTYLEICNPLDMTSRVGRSVADGPGRGFMIVVQVPDLDAIVKRAADVGIDPLFVKPHHVNTISQWHPRDFGILAEFDQIAEGEDWHFTPEVYPARSAEVGQEIMSITLAVDDPAKMAQRWSTIVDIPLGADGRSVLFGDRSVTFIEAATEARGMAEITIRTSVEERSTELCGVRLRLTADMTTGVAR